MSPGLPARWTQYRTGEMLEPDGGLTRHPVDLPAGPEVDIRLAVGRLDAKGEFGNCVASVSASASGTGLHQSTGPSLSALTSPQ